MSVRVATIDDLPALSAMWRRFFADSCFASMCALDSEAFAAFMRGVIESEEKQCLIAIDDSGEPAGMTAMVISPLFFCPSFTACCEMFWWTEPEQRGAGIGGAMLDGVESWAARMGCDAVAMASQKEAGTPDVAGRIYERRGYRLNELSYIKELR